MPTPIHFTSFIEGAYTDAPIINIPPNALYVQDNCVTSYKLGAILKRPGYAHIGTGAINAKPITGLHNFRQTATIQKMLATLNDATGAKTELWYSTGGNWSQINTSTDWNAYEDAKVEFEDFLGYCFMVGYDSTDGVWLPNRTLTGTTFGTTNTTSMPNARYIVRYRDRLYIGNTYSGGTAYPYRVYYSSVPSGAAISWTTATDFLDVDYSEGITGMSVNWDRLVAFTEYSMYFYNQTQWKKMYSPGCSSHRTIRNWNAYMIWANMDNVWVSTGGQPQAIGGRVIDFIRNANMVNSFAEIVGQEYHLYLGSVTVNGVTYSNCTLIYDIPTGTWRWHEYADTMTVFAKFYSSGKDYLWMGSSIGEVHQLGKYTDASLVTTDDGVAINSWFQTGALPLGDPSTVKKLGKIITYADRAQGLQIKARVVDRNNMAVCDFKPLITIQKFIEEKQINPDQGYFLQIEGVENGSLEYWSFFGFTVLADIVGEQKN